MEEDEWADSLDVERTAPPSQKKEEKKEAKKKPGIREELQEWIPPEPKLRSQRSDFYKPLSDKIMQLMVEDDPTRKGGHGGNTAAQDALLKEKSKAKWKKGFTRVSMFTSVTRSLKEAAHDKWFVRWVEKRVEKVQAPPSADEAYEDESSSASEGVGFAPGKRRGAANTRFFEEARQADSPGGAGMQNTQRARTRGGTPMERRNASPLARLGTGQGPRSGPGTPGTPGNPGTPGTPGGPPGSRGQGRRNSMMPPGTPGTPSSRMGTGHGMRGPGASMPVSPMGNAFRTATSHGSKGGFIEDTRPVVHLRLFCFPWEGGNSQIFETLGKRLENAEVLAVQYPGRMNRVREPPVSNMRELAAQCIEAMEALGYLKMPFGFLGHGMGALFAYEIARALRKTKKPRPRLLIAASCESPQQKTEDESSSSSKPKSAASKFLSAASGATSAAASGPLNDLASDSLVTLDDASLFEEVNQMENGLMPSEITDQKELYFLSLPIFRADRECFER